MERYRVKGIHLNLLAKLTLAIAFLILLPATLMMIYFYDRDRNLAINDEIQKMHAYSEAIAIEIDSFLISQRNITRYAVLNNELLSFLKVIDKPNTVEAFNKWLLFLSGISQNISAVFIINTRGVCIASSDPAFINGDLSFRPYYIEALRGKHYVSDWTIGTTAQKSGIYLSSPIRFSDNKIAAVFAIKIDTAPIEAIIQRSSNVGIQAFVANKAGVTLAHYDSSLQYTTVADLTNEEAIEITNSRQFSNLLKRSLNLDSLRKDIALAVNGDTITSKEYEYKGIKKIAALTGMKSIDWVVGITVPFESLEVMANHLLYNFIPLIIFVLIFTIASSFYVSRYVARPLERLLQKAVLLGSGNYNVQAVIKGSDEISELAKAFNSMAVKLKVHNQDLESKVADRTAKLQDALDEIKALSVTDSLTHCYNRRYLDEHIAQEFNHSTRYKRNLSIIMCDIDYFKKVNDTYGHAVGDTVLSEISQILRADIREGIDWLARYGGEEFLIVLPETNIEAATIFAERLRVNIERNSIKIDAHELSITMSFGISTLSENDTLKALLERADICLYKAKQSGRNKVVFE